MTLIQAYPRTSIILIGIIVSLISTFATKFLTNQARMKELRDKQKEHQANLKVHKGNTEKMMEIQKEMMSGSMEMMKHSFKPMLVTLIPFILLFSFIKSAFTTTLISSSWIWYYLIAAIVSSMIYRKLFKIY